MGVSGMSSRSRSVSPSDRSPAGEVLHAHDARDSHICGVMVPFLTSVTACTGAPTHPESKAHATIASGKPLNSADFGLPAQRLYRSLPTALRSCSRLRHPDRESFSWGYRPTSLAPGSRRGAAAVQKRGGRSVLLRADGRKQSQPMQLRTSNRYPITGKSIGWAQNSNSPSSAV